MYYPKSQIKTNLYTNGSELTFASNGNPYVGYYWTTVDGKYYTGKTPQDTPVQELVLPKKDNSFSSKQNISEIVSVSNYTLLKPTTKNTLNIPIFYQPQPTTQDYQTGEFQRYFVKKTNELIYIEVSQDTYNAINTKNSDWIWYDYLAFNLPWSISGDKLQVAKTNNNIVDLTMMNLSLTKFNLYLRDDYTKFYK
jgi:hypothetical protein